jgi:hypothetical protein
LDECAISFHTPETKRVSKQWVKKGQPGPRKAKVHGTRTKKMMLVFFYAKGVIYTNYLNKVKTVNVKYIKKALARFQGEEADHVVQGLVSPLGQRPGPYRRYGPGVSGGEGGQEASPSSLFAGPCPGGLLPLPKGEV